MSTDFPFSDHPLNGDIRECDCCEATVLVHDEPNFPDEPCPATLMLPDRAMINRAMEIVGIAKARTTKGGAEFSEEEALIAMLLDAYIVHRELLTRAVIHGVDGTGQGDEAEDAMRDEALLIGHDILRIGLIDGNTHPDVPRSIDLDIGHVVYEQEDEDDEGDDPDAETVCDVPDCPIHGDKPVPTTYEA